MPTPLSGKRTWPIYIKGILIVGWKKEIKFGTCLLKKVYFFKFSFWTHERNFCFFISLFTSICFQRISKCRRCISNKSKYLCFQKEYCFINNTCVQRAVINPENRCQECDPDRSNYQWSGIQGNLDRKYRWSKSIQSDISVSTWIHNLLLAWYMIYKHYELVNNVLQKFEIKTKTIKQTLLADMLSVKSVATTENIHFPWDY